MEAAWQAAEQWYSISALVYFRNPEGTTWKLWASCLLVDHGRLGTPQHLHQSDDCRTSGARLPMLSHLHWQEERRLGQLKPCGSNVCTLFALQHTPWKGHQFCKGRMVSVTLPSPKWVLWSWHLSKWTNNCCQWSVPWVRGHQRASREFVTRTRRSWDSASKHKLSLTLHDILLCVTSYPLQEGNPLPMTLLQRTEGTAGRFLLEIYPRVSASCFLFLIYSSSFIFHWASAHKIYLCVGGSSPNLLPCCSQSYSHYWYMMCCLCNSLYLEKQVLDSGEVKSSLIALTLLLPSG